MSLRILQLVDEWERIPRDPPVERPHLDLVVDYSDGRMALVESGKEGRWLAVDESDLLEVGL